MLLSLKLIGWLRLPRIAALRALSPWDEPANTEETDQLPTSNGLLYVCNRIQIGDAGRYIWSVRT